MFGRNKVAIIVAEFLGVVILSMAVYSMLARTSFPLFSGLAAGLTIGVMTLVIGNISQAHINPAITLSMWGMRKIDTYKAIIYICSQILGGLAAWWLIHYFIGRPLTSMAGQHFAWKVLVAEALGTMIFAFGAAAAILQDFEPAKRAAVIGISFAIGVMVASLASNGILNPAVALGIQSWNWAYATGPIIGALVGSNLYLLMFSAASASPRATRSNTLFKNRSKARR